jgi:hypothetical protein
MECDTRTHKAETEPEEADKPHATKTGQLNSLSTVAVLANLDSIASEMCRAPSEVYRRCPERIFKVRLGLCPGPAAAPPIVKLPQELMPFSDGTRCGVRFGSNGFFAAPYHRKLTSVDDPR